jgi:hypothetical protein
VAAAVAAGSSFGGTSLTSTSSALEISTNRLFEVDGEFDLGPVPVILILLRLGCRPCLTVVPALLSRMCCATLCDPPRGRVADSGAAGIAAISTPSSIIGGIDGEPEPPVNIGLNRFGVSGNS